MCGLTGIAGTQIFVQDFDTFHDMFYISALRGWHSSGVAAIRTWDKSSPWTIQKAPVAPSEFLGAFAGRDGYLRRKADILMGHARWATRGKINAENAHPFETEKYIGAHNGTLVSGRFQHASKTDSEMLFLEMDQRGIVETLSDLHPNDAWAVSIYDKHTKKLWLGRNDKRPLFVGFSNYPDLMYWSSEQSMIEMAVSREHRGKVTVYELPSFALFEIDVTKIKSSHEPWIVHSIPKPTYKTVPSVSTSGRISSSTSMFQDSGWSDNSDWNEETWEQYLDALDEKELKKKQKNKTKVAELLDEVEASIKKSQQEQTKRALLI